MKRARHGTFWGLAGAAIGAVALLLLAFSPTARAVNNCGGETHQNSCGSANNMCICCTWGNGEDGNCVWWAWEMACREWGVALSTCHNADTWDDYNSNMHIDPDPCAGSVFICEAYTSECSSGDVGHVGWVLDVYADGSIHVSEQGCWWFDNVRERTFDAQLASPAMKYLYEPGQTSCQQCDCTPGDAESRACTGSCAADETRTCDADCTWGAWSGCAGGGECVAMTHQNCGVCGFQQCTDTCVWGPCDDPCAAVDASTPTDAAVPDPDGGTGIGGRSSCSCGAGDRGPGGGELWLLLSLLVWGWVRQRR